MAPDWEKVCAFCHERPRSRHGGAGTYGFCFDLGCQAERAVADALQRGARVAKAVESGMSERDMAMRMYTAPERAAVLRARVR